MKHISLTACRRLQLPSQQGYVWTSDSPNVSVLPGGILVAVNDVLPGGTATVRATLNSTVVEEYSVTIVNWLAEKSRLTEVEKIPIYYVLSPEDEDGFFVSAGNTLWRTTDGMTTLTQVCTLPAAQTNQRMLKTPFGYFYRADNKIYKSTDLQNWTLSFTAALGGLYHCFDSYYNESNQTLYIYVADYSGLPNYASERHKVYRGTITVQSEVWDTVLDFYSHNEFTANKSNLLWAFHVHAVVVDPFTGHVWVTTGDSGTSCRILYSTNNGQTFNILGVGSQAYRGLAFWFTEKYIYWNMDSTDGQFVWRIPRTAFVSNVYPSLTPLFTSGTTKIGVTYQVITSDGSMPAAVGDTYVEKAVRTLSGANSVRPMNDAAYDYKEKVAQLYSGSHWYICHAKDQNGEDVVIMCAAVEGEIRDKKSRVFGFKEKPNGMVEVQEIYVEPPANPADSLAWTTRLEPKLQDNEGNLYFLGIATNPQGIWKMKLNWQSGYVPPRSFTFRQSFDFKSVF